MKRFKYGLNCVAHQNVNWFNLSCVGKFEAAPGETFSGKSSLRVVSESTKRPVMNRVYNDLFAFYVPYRLLWEDWPDFIAGAEGLSVPTTTAPRYQQSLDNSDTQDGSVNAFGQRAYNLIWNKFFRTPDRDEIDIDTAGTQRTPLRPSRLLHKLKTELALADQEITVTDGSFTTGDVRKAFSQDRFDKTRAYYGSKYTDYLAALGVEASWSILDEPELIGMSMKNLPFSTTDATANTDVEPAPSGEPIYVGSMGGAWKGSNTLTLRRTFCPEHGLVMVMQATRMDIAAGNVNNLIGLKQSRDQFYSPEFETERKQAWQPFNRTAEGETWYLEKFEEYRLGQDSYPSNPETEGLYITLNDYVSPVTPEQLNYPRHQDISQDYLNDQFTSTVNLKGTHRLQKVSPIRPSQSVHGVS